jgi:hypothetical protein
VLYEIALPMKNLLWVERDRFEVPSKVPEIVGPDACEQAILRQAVRGRQRNQ